MERMYRKDLIIYIKRLAYKMYEIQAANPQVIKENNKIKTADLEKYKKILMQVREVK